MENTLQFHVVREKEGEQDLIHPLFYTDRNEARERCFELTKEDRDLGVNDTSYYFIVLGLDDDEEDD